MFYIKYSDCYDRKSVIKTKIPWRWRNTVLSQLPAPAQSPPQQTSQRKVQRAACGCADSMKSLIYIRGCTRLTTKEVNALGPLAHFFPIFSSSGPSMQQDQLQEYTDGELPWSLSLFHLNFSHPLLCLGKARLSYFSPYCAEQRAC